MSKWISEKFGEIAELVYGKSLPKHSRADGIVPVYGSNGIVGYHNEAIVDQAGIIVGRKGSAGCINFSKVPFCPIDTTFYITQDTTKLDLEFLRFALEKLDLSRILGDVGVPGLNREMAYLEKIYFPLDRSEQRKIAHVLNLVQAAIEQQDKLIITTTELKKALMQKIFTEGTKGEKQKQTEIGLVPESWDLVKLIEFLEKTKQTNPSNYPDTEFIYVDVSSVSNEFLRISEVNKLLGKNAPSRARKLIQTDDVIFATVRPTLKRIAKIPKELNNQVCSTGYCVLKTQKTKLDCEYLYQFLQTESFISRIEKLQRGASYPAVRDSDVKGMKIPFPAFNEQVAIGKILKTLDDKKYTANSKKQTLSDLFKTLLHELMTGKRRVHEIDFTNLEKEVAADG